MKKTILLAFLLTFGAIYCNTLPEVTNFNAAQRFDGSKLVDIFYDVYDADGDTLTIELMVSADEGVNWDVSCDSLSGDFGDNILSGNDKHIIWNYGAEHQETFGETYRFKLNVNDHAMMDIEWCEVPAGPFTYGQNDEILTIDYGYEIMKYHVTNAQYVEYLEGALSEGDVWIESDDVYGHYEGDEQYPENDYCFYYLGYPVEANYGQISYENEQFMINVPAGYNTGDFDNHPVVEVTWFGANAYANFYGWQLPSNHEWEKAARGNTGYDYPWGDDLSVNRANYSDSGDPWDNGTTPVGFYNGQNFEGFQTIDSPSPYECYDMCGNVQDWINNWYNGNYDNTRVVRGGAWGTYGVYLTYLMSYMYGENYSYGHENYQGFRCIREIEIINQAPDQPSNPSPETGALSVPLDVLLSWECSDPDGDELSYDVYFGETEILGENDIIATGISDTTWQVNDLENNTQYFWKIVASDGELETEGEVWSFTTVELQEIEWCNVPAGEFTYGQNDEILTIDYDYEIMKYEVTNAQYVQYFEEALAAGSIWIQDDNVYGYYEGDYYNPEGNYIYYDLGFPSEDNYARISYENDQFIINVPDGYNTGDFDNHPVVEVSWFGANAYAEYFNYRLPEQEEWEKAARGDIGTDYPWGDELSSNRANYLNSGDPWDNGTSPVGYYNGQIHQGYQTIDSFSPYGCYDMCGNVYDWTSSWRGGSYGNRRVLRGASWGSSDENDTLNSWWIGNTEPYNTLKSYGFRCVKDEQLPNQAPNLPQNPSPETGAINVPLDVLLSWECIDPDGDELSYDVYFGETEFLDENDIIATGISDTIWQINDLENNTQYFWKIVASDGELQTEGEIWNFTSMELESSIKLVYVEGGTFEMGDHFNEGQDDELPVHEVTLSSFYIGQYEITQEEYETISGETPAHSYGVGDNYPVYYVNWYDAVEFCNALSIQDSLTPCYNTDDWSCNFSADGYRLPTEAEWEYAARGRINWEDDFRYSGCHDESELHNYAWFNYGLSDPTHLVGEKLPNQLNIYDMSGNVYEWCNDWYSENYYSASPIYNPTGPDSGSYRISRGGRWASYAQQCRIAFRSHDEPETPYNSIGFRIVRRLD